VNSQGIETSLLVIVARDTRTAPLGRFFSKPIFKITCFFLHSARILWRKFFDRYLENFWDYFEKRKTFPAKHIIQ